MKNILLIPAIFLLVCCVAVGAFNAVTGRQHRPMTFMESLTLISSIEFSLDEMSELINSISDAWASDDASTYPGSSAGSGGAGTVGGRFPDPADSEFGGKDFEADTFDETWNILLNGLSDFVYTIITVVKLLILVIQDTVSIVSTLFEIMFRFVTGVPVSPT